MLQNLKTNLRNALTNATSIAIVGIGAELRGDDAAGLVVANELKKLFATHPPRIKSQVFIGGEAPENITGQLRAFSPSHIILIDAANLSLTPGDAAIIDPAQTGGVTFSTHAMPMSVFVKYLSETLKCSVIVIGIQPRSLDYASKMDKDVQKGCKKLAAAIAEVIGKGTFLDL